MLSPSPVPSVRPHEILSHSISQVRNLRLAGRKRLARDPELRVPDSSAAAVPAPLRQAQFLPPLPERSELGERCRPCSCSTARLLPPLWPAKPLLGGPWLLRHTYEEHSAEVTHSHQLVSAQRSRYGIPGGVSEKYNRSP